MQHDSEHGLRVQLATAQQDLREAHAQIGKERDAWVAANARADAAEARVTYWYEQAQEAWRARDSAVAVNEADLKALAATQEAIAAARRECDAMREVLNTIRRGGGGMDPLGRMEMSRIARDAIAAPGAAPDTSPATLEAWEKRLEREAEVNDPNESEP